MRIQIPPIARPLAIFLTVAWIVPLAGQAPAPAASGARAAGSAASKWTVKRHALGAPRSAGALEQRHHDAARTAG